MQIFSTVCTQFKLVNLFETRMKFNSQKKKKKKGMKLIAKKVHINKNPIECILILYFFFPWLFII